ncbi:hypothetical protein DYB25_012162, partial [Aphanomyces astaci]
EGSSSYFHALLGSGLWKPNSPSDTYAYFLDLDPRLLLGRVLACLRTRNVSTGGFPDVDRDDLDAMLDYLKLNGVPSSTMDFDLGSRGKKLQKEQAARREAARLKMEREKALVEKTNQLRVEMEVEAQRRRDELAQQAAAVGECRQQRITGGIVYKKSLRAVPIANDGDKVTLPVSALEELNPQNALDLGVFTFELVAGGHTTHASVLEFVADEHTIGIPPKVARSLHLMDEAVDIAVRFVRLEKGRAVKLQPRGDGFGDRQIDIKHLLERTLHVRTTHTTLTEGDILLVRHGKVTFEVAVKEIVPEPQVRP